MKSFLAFLCLLVTFSSSFSQEDSSQITVPSKYFLNMSLSGNLTSAEKSGFGMHLSLGYKVTDNFSVMLTSGYMSSYSDPRQMEYQKIYNSATNSYIVSTQYSSQQKIELIPIEFSFRYSFDLLGIKPYIMYSITSGYFFNNENYDVREETRNELTGELINSRSGKANELYGSKKEGFSKIGGRLSVGLLIPVNEGLNLDLSYSFYGDRGMHSISAGFNFDF